MATVTGGNVMMQKLNDIAKKLEKANKVQVGFMSDATYPNGTPVALVAAIQNFGAPSQGIPPRPFFTNMVKKNSKQWAGKLAAVMKANDYDANKSLELMGVGITSQLKNSIKETNSPPLKSATVKRKGFSKPLIDTSMMLNSASHKVT